MFSEARNAKVLADLMTDMTAVEIAKKHHYSKSTIDKLAQKHGIKRKRGRRADPRRDATIREYVKQGRPYRQIAILVGMSSGYVVSQAVKRMKLEGYYFPAPKERQQKLKHAPAKWSSTGTTASWCERTTRTTR